MATTAGLVPSPTSALIHALQCGYAPASVVRLLDDAPGEYVAAAALLHHLNERLPSWGYAWPNLPFQLLLALVHHADGDIPSLWRSLKLYDACDDGPRYVELQRSLAKAMCCTRMRADEDRVVVALLLEGMETEYLTQCVLYDTVIPRCLVVAAERRRAQVSVALHGAVRACAGCLVHDSVSSDLDPRHSRCCAVSRRASKGS
jgi:hypothetical protein